jgi:hypothetical protein
MDTSTNSQIRIIRLPDDEKQADASLKCSNTDCHNTKMWNSSQCRQCIYYRIEYISTDQSKNNQR